MKRSDFLTNAALAAIGIPALFATNSFTEKNADSKSKNISEEFDNNFELDEMTVSQLQEKMEKGTYTSAQITQLYLDRIEAIDKNGPKLNSIIEVNPDALSIAKVMDQERKAGKIRGPLHGIPVVIKDNIDTQDKMMTTAGSIALVGHIAKKDAFIVTQLIPVLGGVAVACKQKILIF